MDLSAIWRQAVSQGLVVQEYPPLEHLQEMTMASGRTMAIPAGTRLEMGVDIEAHHYVHRVRQIPGDHLPMGYWQRSVGDQYQLEFNELRLIRPFNRSAPSADECGFACQPKQMDNPLSLLRRAQLFRCDGVHRPWCGYANGSIIEPAGHFVVVPLAHDGVDGRLLHLPQRMTPEAFDDLIDIHTQCGTSFITFYNHLQAGGSQDHLHFQMVAKNRTYAIENAVPIGIRLPEPLREYPAQGWVASLEVARALLPKILDWEFRGVPFNLVVLGTHVFLFSRPRPAGMQNALRARLACLELAGRFILNDYQVFQTATLEDIVEAMSHETCLL